MKELLVGECELYAVITPYLINIDIKPGSDSNPINLGSNGRIPVSILTNEEVDAADIDASTVRLGVGAAAPVHWAMEDVDEDGDVDMILHFLTQEAGFDQDDTEATLSGLTYDGMLFTGTDSIRIFPSKGEIPPIQTGKEVAPGRNKNPGEPADGKGNGNYGTPDQNKEPELIEEGKNIGKDNAHGQKKESEGKAVGKEKNIID